MTALNWQDVYFHPLIPSSEGGFQVAAQHVDAESLDFGPTIGSVSVSALSAAAARFRRLTDDQCRPQLAALVFSAARQTRTLNSYFPLTQTLDPTALSEFYRLAADVLNAPRFDVRLFGAKGADLTSELPEVAFFVGCHLTEVFFYRRDLLERLLDTRAHVWLYTTPAAFQESGGVAGGSFNPNLDAIQLVLSRLYEGYFQRNPGVAPFLHEFGHLIDFFDAGRGHMDRRSSGFLPGTRQTDGPYLDTEARRMFLIGKGIELERYLKLHRAGYNPGDSLPIGHPYVFQNDTEFIAGYLEMFFRNPHYFASQNPDLFEGFSLAFRQDSRRAWEVDYPYYVEANRGYYLKPGQRPPRPGLTLA